MKKRKAAKKGGKKKAVKKGKRKYRHVDERHTERR